MKFVDVFTVRVFKDLDLDLENFSTLFYELLTGFIRVPLHEIDIERAARLARLPLNQINLARPRASHRASPLWHSMQSLIPSHNGTIFLLQ